VHSCTVPTACTDVGTPASTITVPGPHRDSPDSNSTLQDQHGLVAVDGVLSQLGSGVELGSSSQRVVGRVEQRARDPTHGRAERSLISAFKG